MKKFFAIAFAVSLFLLGGCGITQEMKEGASFAGLKKFWIEDPAYTGDIFSATGSVAESNAVLKNSITQCLVSKGFVAVPNKKEAQIIFRPIWNSSYKQPEIHSRNINQSSQELTIGTNVNTERYATLEIQAILPESGDIWSWRGFSPVNMSATNFTAGQVNEQVMWCLEYFPPDANPSALQEMKQERKEREIKAEENPYKEVLIKERQKREAEAK